MARRKEVTGDSRVQKCAKAVLEAIDILRPALPYGKHFPARISQLLKISFVPFHIRQSLCAPELGVCCGRNPSVFAPVDMPEASVHEDELLSAGENDVRPARQIAPMQAKAEPHSVNDRSHQELRCGVLSLDRRHVPAALFFGQDIHRLLRGLRYPRRNR